MKIAASLHASASGAGQVKPVWPMLAVLVPAAGTSAIRVYESA